MLFHTRFHDPIRKGEITLTFRRWRAPQAKVGGRYRLHTYGVIEATSVETITRQQIAVADARRAGFDSPSALVADLDKSAGDLFRIEFRYLGDLPDERAILAAVGELTQEDREEIEARLAKMDGGGRGAWTRDFLRLIDENEGVRAADLAERLARDTVRFKADVRRLKSMGLTESLDVGYRLSPRGKAVLEPGDGVPVLAESAPPEVVEPDAATQAES
jgi:hypothetical protein